MFFSHDPDPDLQFHQIEDPRKKYQANHFINIKPVISGMKKTGNLSLLSLYWCHRNRAYPYQFQNNL